MKKQKVGDAFLHSHAQKFLQIPGKADALVGDVGHDDTAPKNVLEHGDKSNLEIVFRVPSLGLTAAPGGATE
ncbi:hypothetical protein [Mesorhizobium sp. Cs1299R1N3]|uniref:hypothetical protein n=1 Tax=Mesorhizobium sp. Cs1299R1N3 TaxID=3015173 RepID=UPI00301E47F9